MGIGAAIMPNGHGFEAPDDFRARDGKAVPAAFEFGGGLAVGGGIPSFHGVHGPAIARLEAPYIKGLGHGRFGRFEDGVIDGQTDSQIALTLAQTLGSLQGWDFLEFH